MARAILIGRKVLWFGNGGSAADSQHLAAEFVGRFRRERRGWPSIALTADTSILKPIGNDSGFDDIFWRQAEAPCDEAMSSSASRPRERAATWGQPCGQQPMPARSRLLSQVRREGAITSIADATLCVASKDPPRIQEGHILCGHMLCEWVEASVCEQQMVEGKISSR